MNSETQLIERIRAAVPSEISNRRWPRLESGLTVGIGDDAAVFSPRPKTDLVLSCDASLEGVHFLRKNYPADSIGYKSLARATSDLAAMGATPTFFLLTLALPKSAMGGWLDRFLEGMARAARQLKILLVGGDLTQAATLSLSITVLGEIAKGRAVTRSGARVGDRIYVSGELGRAQLGWELMRRGLGRSARYEHLLERHLFPTIRLELGSWLARNQIASAMIDLSDGLSTDLARLCQASKVGARLLASRIPCAEIPALLRQAPARFDSPPLQLALHGGEDYELLFTIPPDKQRLLQGAPGFSQLFEIGKTTREKGIRLVDTTSRSRSLKPLGWDPFR